MTRINLVPPAELYDQHLFAEFREIKMIPKSLARSLRACPLSYVVRRIPASYTLGTGHVMFFYDKGLYLVERYHQLRVELDKRGINFNRESALDPDGVYRQHLSLLNEYEPTAEALALVRERIASRIALKPAWYRHSGDRGRDRTAAATVPLTSR